MTSVAGMLPRFVVCTHFRNGGCHRRFLPIQLLAHLANAGTRHQRPRQAGDGQEEKAWQQPSAHAGMQRQRLRKPLSILLLTLKPQVNAKDAQRTEPRGRKSA